MSEKEITSEVKHTTVLIVDDHFVARLGIKEFINAQTNLTVVAEATSGEEAIALYRQFSPSIVLMDARMTGLDGVRATIAIRHIDPNARILMVSSNDNAADVKRAQDAGALGYVTKDEDPGELLRAIQAVAQGRRYLSKGLAAAVGQATEQEPLSAREIRILEMISSGRSNREIADHLHLTPGTMRVYVHQILSKMGVANRAAAVSAAIRSGIITQSNP